MNGNSATATTKSLPMSMWPAETFPLEPVQGWINRAAERNYAFSTDSFVDSLGLSGRDWDYDELLKIIQQLPIDSYAEIAHCTAKRSNGGFEICGHRVSYRFISKSERRVCPQCLEEERYVRTWFDFVPIATCPHHNVVLMGGLPNDPLDWRHTEIGWTLSGIKVGLEHARPQIASTLDRFIVKCLTGERASLPDHLNRLSLETVLVASICVGKLHRGDERHTAAHESLRSLCQMGFDPLIGGSDAIIFSLRKAPWLQPGSDKGRLSTRCNTVSNMLAPIKDEGLRNLISDAFARVRVSIGLVSPSGRLSKYRGEVSSTDIKGAAKKLGVTPHTLRIILTKFDLLPKNIGSHRCYRLEEREFTLIEDYIHGAIDSDEAAMRLGCTPQDIDSMVARRLLWPAFRKSGQNRFTAVELDDLINSITSLPLFDASRGGKNIAIYAEQIGISVAEATSRILRKESLVLVDYRLGSPLFEGLQVADAPRMRQNLRLRPNAQVRDAITFAKGAARLGTNNEGIKSLIEASFIKTIKDGRHRNRICPNSLERFEARYVKAAAYAPILGCHPTSALRILREMGVIPISNENSARTQFVERAEVKRITGIGSPEAAIPPEWHAIKSAIDDHLASHSVPATTRVISDPAIEVRATSGRWSFLITREKDQVHFRLTSSFTAQMQCARLRRVQETSMEPSEIWPGASICEADGGGFILVDEVPKSGDDSSSESLLIARAVERAQEIHQVI